MNGRGKTGWTAGCLFGVALRWCWLGAVWLILLAAAGPMNGADDPRKIGIEGEIQITLARGDYEPKALDDRTPLILRIEAVKPVADGRFNYDFHYIGFEPGSYRLGDYLIHPDGSPATELAETMVEVRSVLPADHDGALNAYVPQPFPWFGGYRVMLGGLAVLWVCGLAAFAWFGRRRKSSAPVAVEIPEPSYAERLRPLVEAAATGTLDVPGQAELERLFTGYWRERLGASDRRMADTLAGLKRHPEAGALLRALERWLHRPGGVSAGEINELLEPYRQLPVAAEKEVGA
jgi:hypothetical protein